VTNQLWEGRQIGADRGMRLDRDDARRVCSLYPIFEGMPVNHIPALECFTDRKNQELNRQGAKIAKERRG
jgi:hypothetical protein